MTGREELRTIRDEQQLAKLNEVMCLISELKLDEEQLPTPLFQAIFSRIFWNNVKRTSKGLDGAN